jgi:hypothetical protein
MKRYLVIGGMLALLSGCVSPEEQAKLDLKSDRNDCEGYGFTRGTDEFAECMQKAAVTRANLKQRQDEQRQQQRQFEAAQEAQNQQVDKIDKFDKDGNPNYDADGRYIGGTGMGKLVDNPDIDSDGDGILDNVDTNIDVPRIPGPGDFPAGSCTTVGNATRCESHTSSSSDG